MKPEICAKIILMLILAAVVPAFARAPAWFSENILKKTGKVLEVSCSGSGPDKSVANRVSADECRALSLPYVDGVAVKTRSLSIEDSRQAAWHSESATDVSVTGLQCEPLKQDCSEADGSWTCYMLCRFNLAKAKVTPAQATAKLENSDVDASSLIVNKSGVVAIPAFGNQPEKAPLLQSPIQQLIVTTIPMADSILVVGRARVIKIDRNPITILLLPEDKELIAEKRGYKPKHVQLRSDRKPTGFEPVESLELYLEKL